MPADRFVDAHDGVRIAVRDHGGSDPGWIRHLPAQLFNCTAEEPSVPPEMRRFLAALG